jgi:hypothetical protein
VSLRAEILLGIIAVSTLAMAIGMVGAFVAAGRLARRLETLLDQLERDVTPIIASLNDIGRDASRAAALATAQMERVDRLFGDVAFRVDQTLQGIQTAVAGPAREGRAVLSALAVALRAIRLARERRARSEEEDALFI